VGSPDVAENVGLSVGTGVAIVGSPDVAENVGLSVWAGVAIVGSPDVAENVELPVGAGVAIVGSPDVAAIVGTIVVGRTEAGRPVGVSVMLMLMLCASALPAKSARRAAARMKLIVFMMNDSKIVGCLV